MKKVRAILGFFVLFAGMSISVFAQTWDINVTDQETSDLDSIVHVQTLLKPEIRQNTVQLADGKATVKVPVGYGLLTASGANFVLEKLWGNRHDPDTLWLMIPEGFPEDGKEWGVVISYQEVGYVSDSDANELLDSAKLLKSLQETQDQSNKLGASAGITPFDIVDWMAKPSFDSVAKKISWWLRMRSQGADKSESLNYQIRILGREGYMDLQGLGSTQELPKIKAESEKIMQSIEFNPGKRYTDYNPTTDKIAEYGLLGLIWGGAIAKKVGLLALIAKFWKILLVAIIAIYVKLRKKIAGLFRNDSATESNELSTNTEVAEQK